MNWDTLGFSYTRTDWRYVARCRDGVWEAGTLTDNNYLMLAESSPALHYGQQCFEGLKAFRCQDGSINLFRADRNAARLQQSCERLLIPPIPTEQFIEACTQVIKANERFVPPYGSGCTLYLRPFVIGVGNSIFAGITPEFIFCVFCTPVGSLFKNGLKPSAFMVSAYDRAAPNGTGAAKVGGNYAASLLPGRTARDQDFADCIYLDPATHTRIEEVGTANFFAITHDNRFVTPASPSILKGITLSSLAEIAQDRLGMTVSHEDIHIDQLEHYKEAGACGTAAVITPIGAIAHQGKRHVFHDEHAVGPVTTQLFDTLTGIQKGDLAPPAGWITKLWPEGQAPAA